MPKKSFLSLPGKEQDEFFDMALEVFAHEPYQQASLSTLLNKAGIAKGTFYQYFSDKLDLYDYLVTNVFALKQFYLKSRMPEQPDDFFRVFEILLRLETGFCLQHPSFHSLLSFATDPRLSPFTQDRIDELTQQQQQLLHKLLVRCQLKGSVITSADARLVTFCCQLMLEEFHRYVSQQIRQEREALCEASASEKADWIADSSRRFMNLFRRGLAVQKSS